MMDAGRHPGIEILISSEVTGLTGEPGAFRAQVHCRSVGVDPDLCTGCGDCAEVCPVKAPNPFDVGVSTRKAIFRPFPQSVPAIYTVDPDLCLSTPEMIRCERCVKACPTGAAQLDRRPKELELEVGAVVVATGFEEFDPRGLRRYGYTVYPNVMTSVELERLLNASGPTLGHVKRPSDGKAPKNLVYVQCVGARGEDGRPYCSRFCCMNAVKDAMLLRQHDPNIESVTILYMDIRAFGKGFEEFYQRARGNEWIRFLRGRPSKILQDEGTNDLEIFVEDTETGRPLRLAADMVVLSCAGAPSPGTAELADRLGIEISGMGFITANTANPVLTTREGILVCGSASGPQVIPDCVAQGSAAATEAAVLLRELGHARPAKSAASATSPASASTSPGSDADAKPTRDADTAAASNADAKPTRDADTTAPGVTPDEGPDWAEELPDDFDPSRRSEWRELLRRDGASLGAGDFEHTASGEKTHEAHITPIDPGGAPRVGVFLCHCGINIAGTLDMKRLLEYARTLPRVVHASDELFACSSSSQTVIQEAIQEHRLNRIVVAACTPRTHEPIFREACQEAGLNPYLVEMVNIRDQCSWVHADDPAGATEKARDLMRMATARAQRLAPLETTEVDVTRSVLVIGGGLPGMKAASDLRALGFEVTLVEGSERLGGLLSDMASLFPEGHPPEDEIAKLVGRMRLVGVDLRLGTEVRKVSGFVGNFRATLGPAGAGTAQSDGTELEVGAIIVAIGADPYQPQHGEYGYGQYDNVITSLELDRRLRQDPGALDGIGSVAFIQCVGSRCAGEDNCTGYVGCSRVCCPVSVRQALDLGNRDVGSLVFYRDMRMVGSGAEELYARARAQGTVFLRFDSARRPVVTGDGGRGRAVRCYDTLIHSEVEAEVDLVVLAVGLVPRGEEAARIQEMLKTPKGADGFFLERHPELGPVETCVDGVILAGEAQGPKDLADAITQATAAAAKAATLLGKGRLHLDPAVCRTDDARCRGCGICVSICEFRAPRLVARPDGSQTVEINPALCKGCGTCAVWCPTGAIEAQHFTDDQIESMIDSLFLDDLENTQKLDDVQNLEEAVSEEAD